MCEGCFSFCFLDSSAICESPKSIHSIMLQVLYVYVNNHIYSTLFKIQERQPDRRSKEIAEKGIQCSTQKYFIEWGRWICMYLRIINDNHSMLCIPSQGGYKQ